MKVVKIGVALLVVAGLVVGAVKLVKKRKAEDAATKTAKIYPVVVNSITPTKKEVKTTLDYIALVKNNKDVVVNSKFAGQIKSIVNLGDRVSKGEIVVRIDDTTLRAKLNEVNNQIKAIQKEINADKINLETLKQTHARTAKLLKVGLASVEQFNAEKAKIANLEAKLKADLEKLKSLNDNKKAIVNDLAYSEIKSPVDGIVSAKFLNRGDNVFPGKPILKIASTGGNYLYLPLAKPYKEVVYKGQTYPLIALNETFNGVPAYKADVNDKSLISEELVDVKVVTFDGVGTLLPFDAILSVNSKNYVFDTRGNPIEVNVIATGKEGVVVSNEINKPIIVAKPDILLKIKAGYPVKVEN